MKRMLIILVMIVGAYAASSQTISFVMFDNIRAYEKNGGVQIEWTNLSERDLKNYVIEHSSDGNKFDSIYNQQPLKNHSNRADYSAYDESPGTGANYYRIRVSGMTGRSATSIILKVEVTKKDEPFSIFPNPVVQNQLVVNINKQRPGTVSIVIYDMSGTQVMQKNMNYPGRYMTQVIMLPPNLAAGVYGLFATDGDWQQRKTFVKQ